MTVCIVGATGGVGQWLVRAVLESDEFTLTSAVARRSAGQDVGAAIGDDECGVIVAGQIEEALDGGPYVVIDFTHPSVRMKHVMAAVDRSIPVVIGTTGFTAAELGLIDEAARRAGVGLVTGNMSLTAALLQHFCLMTAEHIPNWTILEYCKPTKPDVPRGTARGLAERMGEVRQPHCDLRVSQHIGDTTSLGADVAGSRVHAVRLPGITEAAVEVLFGLPGERLSIRHDSEHPSIFAGGSLLAAQKCTPSRASSADLTTSSSAGDGTPGRQHGSVGTATGCVRRPLSVGSCRDFRAGRPSDIAGTRARRIGIPGP